MSKSCMSCRWASCSYYGFERPVCLNYIEEPKPLNPKPPGKFYLTKHHKGKGDVFYSYTPNQYGHHFAWDKENLRTYDSEEEANRAAYHMDCEVRRLEA